MTELTKIETLADWLSYKHWFRGEKGNLFNTIHQTHAMPQYPVLYAVSLWARFLRNQAIQETELKFGSPTFLRRPVQVFYWIDGGSRRKRKCSTARKHGRADSLRRDLGRYGYGSRLREMFICEISSETSESCAEAATPNTSTCRPGQHFICISSVRAGGQGHHT